MRNKITLLLIIISLFSINAFAQKVEKKIINPILVDKKAMSGLDLKPVKNKQQPNRKLFQKQIFRGEDISVYIVSSETASASFDSYGIEEFIYLINGRAKFSPKNEKVRRFNTGDFFIAPKGYAGEWETQGGNKYYYELSVISTKRSDKEKVSKITLPYLVDKSLLSGINITRKKTSSAKQEFYTDKLFNGAELSVNLQSENPRTVKINKTNEDELIYVSSGIVSITPKSGESETFYTGDFFILPKGFSGNWDSKGHHLFRSLRVKKAEQ